MFEATSLYNLTYLRNSICVVSGKQSKFRNILLPLQEWQHKTIINVGLFLHSPCFAHRLQLSFVSRHFESAILKKQKKCETSILKKKFYTISQSILSQLYNIKIVYEHSVNTSSIYETMNFCFLMIK